MGGLSTAVRAFFTRRLDPYLIVSYAVLCAATLVVVALAAVIVVNQLSSL